jgi:formamidopyrimidine-DNA glycosylase
VPELPDLTIVAEAFHASLVGRPVTAAAAPGPLAVRGTPAELEALVGQRVTDIRQRGKFLLIDFDRDRVVVNPMLTGRFQLASPEEKHPTKTAVVLTFGAREAPPKRPAAWTKRAAWMPADDTAVEVRYRDPTQMGKVYLLPAGLDRSVPGLADTDLGPDADDPALTLDVWRQRIRRHPGELKNLLKNQGFIAGVGNAYSDEILHTAGLSPYAVAGRLRPEQVDELYAALRAVLTDAVERSVGQGAARLKGEKRSGLRVHARTGLPCPVCGDTVREVSFADRSFQYCPGCQTSGRPLADGRLSRLVR